MVLTGIRSRANRLAPSTWVLGGVLLIQVLLSLDVGVNPMSRLAGMAAFCRTGSLEISEYVGDERTAWTIDWARTPDGKTYSNKAPGGVVLGIPVYCALQFVLGRGESAQDQYRLRYAANWILSLLFQILPLGFLVHRLVRHAPGPEASRIALVLALGIGNTAAVFMNTWFGHGLIAVFGLGILLAILERRPALAGVLVGLGVAIDYSALLALPALLFVGRGWDWKRFTLGLLPGFGLLGGIHTLLFGAPWILVQKFQNPAFVDVTTGSPLFGVFHSVPRLEAIAGLLFGFERGLLWTQPIVVIGLLWGFFFRGAGIERVAWRFSIAYFALLFLMNATFGAWHAGGSAGPRYLSGALPLLAYFGVRAIPRMPRCGWAALAVSVAFGILVFATTQSPGRGPVWPELLGRFWSEPGIRFFRLGIALVILGGSLGYASRLIRQNRLPRESHTR